MRHALLFVGLSSYVVIASVAAADDGWRSLPLIADGKVEPNWVHVGWGEFVVDDGALRTACDQRGMGLLVFQKEKFGDCQIRVVYKAKDAKSNAGVYVRIDDGILPWAEKKPLALNRNARGKLSSEMLVKLQASAEAEEGAWYAVHHGFEVQICDAADALHRTGAIYSLAAAKAPPKKSPDEWKTMVITLDGEQIRVAIDDREVSSFDAAVRDVGRERHWTEPKLDVKRPRAGYIGLQNHDPGDVVYFREVSVRPLDGLRQN